MTKEEMIQALDYKNINEDTYLLVKGLLDGVSYEETCEYIDKNREQLNIPLTKKLTTKKTCLEYYKKLTDTKFEMKKDIFPMTLEEMRKYLQKQIKLENYRIIADMLKGHSYQEAIEKQGVGSIAESTCKIYIGKIKNAIQKEKENREKEWYNKIGVYGIYIDSVLVYIGMTMTGFQHRFKEHKSNYHKGDLYVYRIMKKAKEQGKEITMKPLISLDDKFSLKEVEAMEFALITYLQPVGNIRGRVMPYYHKWTGGVDNC